MLAGVPPDYFSADGQLWGNPHYRWDVLRQSGYAWWIERFRALLALVDAVRIDHFRGFEASWEVPAGASTAVHGTWVKGPGAALFDELRFALETDRLPLVAENLGVITAEVEALRQQFGLPGMAILHSRLNAPGPRFQAAQLPANWSSTTGTHLNDTNDGWWKSAIGHSTRIRRRHRRRKRVLDPVSRPEGRELHWVFIRAVMGRSQTRRSAREDLSGLAARALEPSRGRPRQLAGRMHPGQVDHDTDARLGVTPRRRFAPKSRGRDPTPAFCRAWRCTHQADADDDQGPADTDLDTPRREAP